MKNFKSYLLLFCAALAFNTVLVSCKKFKKQCEGALNERKWFENYDGKCIYNRYLTFYWNEDDTAQFNAEGVLSINILIDSDTMAQNIVVSDYDPSVPVNECYDPNWIRATKIVYPNYEHFLKVYDQDNNIIITRILNLEDNCNAIRLKHY